MHVNLTDCSQKNVPNIYEEIFFSLDYESFKKCLEVSKSWNDLLTSESFQSRGKFAFCDDVQKELLLAAEKGNVNIIRGVLSSFMVDTNFMTEINQSPLLLAAENGHKDAVQLLIDRGAEPNRADQYGNTPLHNAALEGHKDVVQLLLDRGAEPNMADQDGRTPLHLAAYGGHKDVVQLLLDRGAEPNKANYGVFSHLFPRQNGFSPRSSCPRGPYQPTCELGREWISV